MKNHTFLLLIAFVLCFNTQPCSSQTSGLSVTKPDMFSDKPVGTYQQRKLNYLEYAAKYGENGDKDLQRIFPQIARTAIGLSVENDEVRKALKTIYSNTDCNDFTINGLLRLSYMDKNKPVFDRDIKKEVENCILDFKYWWDDARRDTTYRCYHTENHQALYHTAELLAGQLFKDRKFTSGLTGAEHMKHATERLEPWLEYRFRFGFSEWLSTYYEVDIMILTNLYDFAEDESIRSRAGIVLDVLFYDLALGNFHGVLPSTSGRMYSHSLITGTHAISPSLKLAFGEGQYLPDALMGNTSLALSKYEVPEILREIATDYSTDLLSRQRISINVEDAYSHGLFTNRELDIHFFWGMQEFIHPKVIRMSKFLSDKYHTYPYRDYEKYIGIYENQVKKHGRIVDAHLDRYALSEANIEIYRTADFMLSTAMDYRKRALAYQQHIWQASLDRFAVVFTNYPGSDNPMKGSPNYWAGSEILPRSAQFKTVSVSIYDIPKNKKFDFTHAYFPKHHFDEVVEQNSWIFGRKGNGYVALRSQNQTIWKANKDGNEYEIIAKGRQNIWICEVGRAKEWGSFEKFIKTVSSAEITFDGLDVSYDSPSQGNISFGWDTPFSVAGELIPLRREYRYDNPYSKTKFDSKKIMIQKGNRSLILDYESGNRIIK